MTVAATHECTREQAEEITSRFRDAVGRVETAFNVVVTIAIDAFAHRVWIPLGYSTWDAYCAAEVDTAAARIPRDLRVQIVGQMSEAGMSTRAIGAAVGVDQKTVINDRRRGEEISSPADVTVITAEQFDTLMESDEPEDAPALREAFVNRATGEVIEEPVKVTGVDGKTYTAPRKVTPYRKPLPDVAKGAGWELRKAMERVEKLFDDNRYRQNEEQVAAALRGHLLYVAETAATVLDQLSN